MSPRLSDAVTLAGLAAVLALGVAGCGGSDTATDPPPSTSVATPTSAATRPSDPAEPAPTTPGPPTSGPATVAVPLYFVGTTPQGPRLYREFQQLPASDTIGEALTKIGSGDADDPDYRTLLPGAGLNAAGDPNGDAGDSFQVHVPSGMTARPTGMTDKEARLAVQQVVYTVDANVRSRLPVSFVDASGAATPFLGLDSPSRGFAAAPPLSVLAQVNITQPAQDSEPGDYFTASGVASSFEATVPWEVRDPSGQVVAHGSAQADGYLGKLWPWKADVDLSSLPPGHYTFVAMTDDPSDGEGPGPTEDTKLFTLH